MTQSWEMSWIILSHRLGEVIYLGLEKKQDLDFSLPLNVIYVGLEEKQDLDFSLPLYDIWG